MKQNFDEFIDNVKRENAEYKMQSAKYYEEIEDYNSAFKYYSEVADEKPSAQIKLGDYYFKGLGVDQDYNKAMEWYARASSYNISEALYKLGKMYQDGLGVTQNYDDALELYEKASSLNNASAQYEMGKMYEHGIGVDQDLNKAFYWYNEAGKSGHIQAKVNVGYCYCNGVGTPTDLNKGIEMYEEASNYHNPIALFNLGMCYKSGYGVNKDIYQAIHYFEEAGKNGYGRAYYEIALIYENEGKNDNLILEAYKNAYENGYENALEKVATLSFKLGKDEEAISLLKEDGSETSNVILGGYYFETSKTSSDYKKALSYLSEAAQNDNPEAQYYVGLAYLKGNGLTKDEKSAIECFSIAADNNCLKAINILADLYEQKNDKKVIEMLNKAVDLGNSNAMYKLGYYYMHGKFAEKNVYKGIEYYNKAANLHNPYAECNLGVCYLYGNGVEKSSDFGIYWLRRAVSNEYAPAMYNLGNCYELGIGVLKDLNEAKKYYLMSARKGNSNAKVAIAKIYRDYDHNYTDAFYWLNDCIKDNKDEAYIELASMYIDGLGTNVNKSAAEYLLRQVKNQNIERYLEVINKLK